MPKYTQDQLREMFDKADFSKDKGLFHNELVVFLKQLGVNLNASDIIDQFDYDGDGELQFNEFVTFMNK